MGNKVADDSDVVGALPVGAALTTSSFSVIWAADVVDMYTEMDCHYFDEIFSDTVEYLYKTVQYTTMSHTHDTV